MKQLDDDKPMEQNSESSQTINSQTMLPPVEALLATDTPNIGLLSVDGFSNQDVHDGFHRYGFMVGDVGLMMRYKDGNQLTDVPDITRLPNVPSWFKGYANLQGNLVPVFDLAQYLKLTEIVSTTDKVVNKQPKKLLVLLHNENMSGFLVDETPIRLVWQSENNTAIETAPEILQPHIKNAVLLAENIWFDIDFESLTKALEQAI